MKLVTYVETITDLEAIRKTNISSEKIECIVSSREFSRFSKNTINELNLLISLLKKYNYKIIFEWDLLEQQSLFLKTCEKIKEVNLHDVEVIRVQDPGALEFALTKLEFLKIQLILENGNHNLIGLKRWCDYIGDRLERIVISNELSYEHLKNYANQLRVPLEVLVYGRILLFYSPRKLMSPLVNLKDEYIEAFGTSEESPHSGFPLIENIHGTFMFNVKDLFLIDHLNELESIQIHHFRVDLRFDNSIRYLSEIVSVIKKEMDGSLVKEKIINPRPFIKGFYNVNKTDVLFTKLKNHRTQRKDDNYLGEIIDVEKDYQLTFLVKKLKSLDFQKLQLLLVTPEGKEKVIIPNWLKDSNFNEVNKIEKDQIVLIPYLSGVTVKTQIYLLNM